MSKKTIGIVDDDAAIRDSLGLLLAARGFKSRCFSSAAEFLDAGDTDLLSGLLVDQQMPNISGVELLELLRSRQVPTPVIMMTGGSDGQLEQRARRAGALALLRKPLSSADLMTWLAAMLASEKPAADRSLQ